MPVTSPSVVEDIQQVTRLMDRDSWYLAGYPIYIPLREYMTREMLFLKDIPSMTADELFILPLIFTGASYQTSAFIPESVWTESLRARAAHMRTSYAVGPHPESTMLYPAYYQNLHGWFRHLNRHYFSHVSRIAILGSTIFGARYAAYILGHGTLARMNDPYANEAVTARNLISFNSFIRETLDRDQKAGAITADDLEFFLNAVELPITLGDRKTSISEVVTELEEAA